MLKIITLLFALLLVFHTKAQRSETDSLIALLPNVNQADKVDLYNQIGLSYRGVSFAKVKEYCLKSYLLAKELNLPDKTINALSNLAIANVIIGNIDTAGILFNKIFQLADSLNDSELIKMAKINLGNYYLNTNNFDIALEYYEQVYPEYQKLNDTLNMASIEENIGNIHYRLNNFSKAIESFFLATSLYKQSGHYHEANVLCNNIGLTFLKLNLPDSALYYLENGLEYSRNTNNLELEMRIFNNLGLLSMTNNDYQQSVAYFKTSIQLSKDIVNPFQEGNGLLNIAEVYIRLQNFDSAFAYLHMAKPILDKQGNLLLLKNLNELYYQIYSKRQEFEKALIHYQKYNSFQDSIFNQETQNRIASLNIRFETAKKEAENIRLKSELDLKIITQRRLMHMLIIISLLFVSLSVTFYFIWKFLKQKNTIARQEAVILAERLEHSQKELASKALHLASQNEFRIKLLGMTNEVYEHLDQAGRQNINGILKNLESSIDQSVWQEFETRFEHVQEAFFTRLNLQYPDLTPNDRRICAFLKMNMSTKDIALLTHRSPRSIESSRYRLKKKFGLGPDEEILPFLQSI